MDLVSATMTIHDKLLQLYGNRVLAPSSFQELPKGKFLAYMLVYNDKPIVVGHGKKERAKVIFDNEQVITEYHIKALTVRLYWLFGDATGRFERFLVVCDCKEEAYKIEKTLHKSIGGNSTSVPMHIHQKLFEGIAEHSTEWMVINLVLSSSYGGISDLRKWKRRGFLNERVWQIISDKLKIP